MRAAGSLGYLVEPSVLRRTKLQTAITDALTGILPREDETWLLRACLHSGQLGRQAWESFEWRAGDPVRLFKKDRRGLKRILPNLSAALQANNVPASPEFATYLRLAYLYEEGRSKEYRRICHEVLSILHAEGIPLIVLKGAAFGETLYRDPALRHSHDVELLVSKANLERAAAALARCGLARGNGDRRRRKLVAHLTHPAGVPVELRVSLFRTPSCQPRTESLWSRSAERTVAAVPARILSREDNLFHVCVHAAHSPSRRSLLWASDAWLLLGQDPPIDWDLIFETASESRVRLPLTVMLGYLVRQLEAPIPEVVLDRFLVASREIGPGERDAALLAARSARGGGWRSLLRSTRSWQARLVFLRSAFLPSAEYLRQTYRLRHPSLLPLLYLYRPVRYTFRTSRKLLARALRRLALNGTRP